MAPAVRTASAGSCLGRYGNRCRRWARAWRSHRASDVNPRIACIIARVTSSASLSCGVMPDGRAPRRELRRTLQQVVGLHEQRGCQGIQIGVHRASRSDVGWRDARARVTLMAPALWAGKGTGRADRGKRALGYGSGLARRWVLFSPARATLARRPRVPLGHRRVRTSRRQACASSSTRVWSTGCGQCVSRCTARARMPRPTVSLSARIAPLAAMVISQPRRVLGRRMC